MNAALGSGEAYELFNHNIRCIGAEGSVLPVRKPFSEALETIGASKFDIIFIDGSHMYSDVLFDIQQSLPLVKSSGIICGDDLELSWDKVPLSVLSTPDLLDFDTYIDAKAGIAFHPGVSKAVWETLGPVCSHTGFWLKSSKWSDCACSDVFTIPWRPPHVAKVVLLVREAVGDYNILFFDDSYVAVPMSAGRVTPENIFNVKGAKLGSSFQAVLSKIT